MAFFGGGGASVDLASPPAIGNTTANTGRFTTVESTSRQFITTVDGSIQIGKDGGNALGGNSITIQPRRFLTERVASGTNGIAIGESTRAASAYAIAIGTSAQARTESGACAIGYACDVTSNNGLALGGDTLQVSAANATNLNGANSSTANLRGMLLTRSFASLYWSGTTTNNTPTILNLEGTATNRFTIAANTAAMVDLNIIARRTDTVDKWFSSRRTVAIRRNNANGTAIIGSVQNVGTDQTEGSPTWSVAITADDTNEALQVEVTGATSETVSWRVMAFYQVV